MADASSSGGEPASADTFRAPLEQSDDEPEHVVPTTLFQRTRLSKQHAWRVWATYSRARRMCKFGLRRRLLDALVSICQAWRRWRARARGGVLIAVGSYVAMRTALRTWHVHAFRKMRRRSSAGFQGLLQTQLNSQLIYRLVSLVMAMRVWRKRVRHIHLATVVLHIAYTRRCRAAMSLWRTCVEGRRRAANIAAVVERMLLIRRGRALLACWLQRADNHKLSTMLLVYGGNVRRSRALRRWSAAASTSALSKARCERALEVCTRRMRRARLASALISWLAMLWRTSRSRKLLLSTSAHGATAVAGPVSDGVYVQEVQTTPTRTMRASEPSTLGPLNSDACFLQDESPTPHTRVNSPPTTGRRA